MEGARPAVPDDVGRLAELYRGALDELRPLRGGSIFAAREARQEPIEATLMADLEDPMSSVWAGTYHDVVFGYGIGHLEELADGQRLGVVDDLYVEAEARKVGVGGALLEHLVKWFRDQGCVGIDGRALPGDRNTKNFFEAAGFTARLLVMHHRLS